MTRRTLLSCITAVCLFLVTVPATSGGVALASSSARLSTHLVPGAVPAAVSDGSATLVGPRPTTDVVSFTVDVTVRNLAALMQFMAAFNDPSSPSYHQPLTLSQANQLFNPTTDQEQQLTSWLQANGFTVTGTYANHLLVDAQGTVGQVESAFHLTIDEYRATVGGKEVTFYAPAQDPTIPAAIAGLFNGIIGLDTYPRFSHASNGAATGSPAYYPQDFANAYDLNPLWNAGYNGAGQHIGVIMWETPPSDSTLQNFAATTGASAPTQANGRLKVIPVDGGGSSVTDDGEAGMDIEYSSGMAPGATIDYYQTPTDSQGNPTDQGLLDALNQAGTDANNNRQISNSWGGCEATSTSDSFTKAAEQIFAADTATGHNFFFASGDNGSACNPNDPNSYSDPYPDYPPSSPNVTAVGGTAFNSNIGSNDPGESAWAYCASCDGAPEGSGGGYSQIFSRPAWQTGLPGSASYRGYPDVSAVGDPSTGAYVCYGDTATCDQIGGTSLSTPMWAGISAVLNQYLAARGKPSLGFLNPRLYTLATTAQAYPPYHDVTSGNNGAYSAGSGWDAVTGWGTPDVWNIARDVAGSAAASPTITASPNPVPSGSTTTTISWNTGDGSFGQVWVSANGGADTILAQAASGSASIPWISSGSTYVFKLFAGTSHSTQLASVTVTGSVPTISASPNPVSVNPGSSGTSAITWSTGNGSTGQVYVAVNGGGDILFAQGPSGTASAPWISAGSSYVFKLYAGTSHSSQLASVTVTTSVVNNASISASPNPVTTGSSTTITWSTGTGSTGQVYVSVNGGGDILFAQGPSGSATAPWIATGGTYVFKLFAGTGHATQLGSVTVTASASGTCPSSQSGCTQAIFNMLNQDRANFGLPALAFSATQSNGTASCVGSMGHSTAMAASGSIWHQNPSYPNASFWTDVCLPWTAVGENVGKANSGNELTDLQNLDQTMMSEPHDPATCASQTGSHSCNILNPAFTQVGIGIYYSNGVTWLTEDFVG